MRGLGYCIAFSICAAISLGEEGPTKVLQNGYIIISKYKFKIIKEEN